MKITFKKSIFSILVLIFHTFYITPVNAQEVDNQPIDHCVDTVVDQSDMLTEEIIIDDELTVEEFELIDNQTIEEVTVIETTTPVEEIIEVSV